MMSLRTSNKESGFAAAAAFLRTDASSPPGTVGVMYRTDALSPLSGGRGRGLILKHSSLREDGFISVAALSLSAGSGAVFPRRYDVR